MNIIGAVCIASLMIWVIIEDFRSKTIPDAVPSGLIAYAFTSSLLGEGIPVREACWGLIIGGGLMFILSVVSVMGGGDIKLMGALGMWFGFRVLDTFFLSFIIGAVFALVFYIKYRNSKQEIPFGPAIALAALSQSFCHIEVLGMW